MVLIFPQLVFGESQPINSIEEAATILKKALEFSNAGRYEEAIPHEEKALEILEEVLGKDHLDVAAVLNYLAELYRMTGRYAEAEPLFKRSLEINEKALGKDNPAVAAILSNLAFLYQTTGKYAEAEPLYKRVLEIYEKSLGKDHPDVARILNNLASLFEITGRYAEAEPLCKRSLEIFEKAHGRDHPDVATSLNNLAGLYKTTGRYAEAEPLFKRGLEIRERVLGKDHLSVALNLNNLALLYQTTGRYAEAEPLYKRSLEIREKTLPKDHPDVAQSLHNLAFLYQTTGRYAEAEPLYKLVLEIKERVLGKGHLSVALSLNNLAAVYQETGRYAEAEPLLRRAIEIYEKVLGREHPDVTSSLCNLALLYQTTGRYAEAESLYKRSLQINEKALGKDHPEVARNLGSLASLYLTARRFAEAEPLGKRSLEIMEKALGKGHPYVAMSLNNLAAVYQETGRYAEAEPLYKRALEIRERALGKDHPYVGASLNNLGWLYQTTGRYAEAEPLYRRSLEIFEKLLGKYPAGVQNLFENLGNLYLTTEKYMDSHQFFNRGIGIMERERENVFLLLSEKQKTAYMEQTKGSIDGFLSHTAQYLSNDNLVIEQTFDAWLRWKGAVMEAQGRYIDALTYSEYPDIKKKFEELNNTRREIARLQISGSGKMNSEEYKKRLEELEKKKEVLEAELTRLSKDFALEKMVGKADTKKISEILLKKEKGSVYIDFALINIYDFKEKKFTKPRYLIFVLLPEKEPLVKLLNLSDAGDVDTHIRNYLEEMKRAKEFGEVPRERILKAEARALYDILLRPIEKEITGKKHLYISPDGNLNLIPFEVLMTPERKYLMEEYNITYIAAGRDITRFADTNVAKGEPIIMADPDFDMELQEKTQVAKTMGVIETRGTAPLTRDAKDLRFKRLPDTKQEADAIEKCLRESQKINVRNYQDKNALEEVLLTARNPRILHLATHGYFLKDEEVKHQPMLGFMTQERERMMDIGIENPMLRSGIVLAGANASLKEGRDDGIVSAEKILGLRLKGTDLVVLSACDTGTGEVKSGEGVFGLKRSFILSGAKTVVMSLWSIPSKETTELMTDFYTLMAKGKTKAEALREARLNLMKKKPNPFYWGAFIMVGNPN